MPHVYHLGARHVPPAALGLRHRLVGRHPDGAHAGGRGGDEPAAEPAHRGAEAGARANHQRVPVRSLRNLTSVCVLAYEGSYASVRLLRLLD